MSLFLNPILSVVFSWFSPLLLWWYFNPSTFFGIIIMAIVHVILSQVFMWILYWRIK
jgi:hypothetical protein